MIDKKIFNIISWMDGCKAPPYILEIRPTTICNLKCISCGQPKDPIEDRLSGEKLISLIKEASRIGVRRIEICGGGEPLMAKITSEIILLIKDLGMEGVLTTNATLFSEELIKGMVEKGWDEILVSLDGPDAETHDYLRGVPGTFDKVMKNLTLFKKWKGKLGRTKPILKLVPVLSNKNYAKLEKFMELANKLSIFEVRFQPLYAFNDKQNSLKLSMEDEKALGKYVEQARNLANKYNIDTNVDIFLKETFTGRSMEIYKSEDHNHDGKKGNFSKVPNYPFIKTKCFFPWFYMGVIYNNAVIPCPAFSIHDADQIEDKGLLDMWHSEKFENLRSSLKENKLPDFCERCCGGLVINNQDLKKQLECYIRLHHMNFSDMEAVLFDYEKRIKELGKVNAKLTIEGKEKIKEKEDIILKQEFQINELKQELENIKNSLTFQMSSKVGETSLGKILKNRFRKK